MREPGRSETPTEHLRAISKRKQSSRSEQLRDDHEHSKRQKFVHQRTETLTLMPHRSVSPPFLNFGESTRCSSLPSGRIWRRNEEFASSVERKWVFSSRDFSNIRDKALVVSYNLLGVENASNHRDLYFNVPPRCLEWDIRKHLICKEISRYKASILCLQEVDRFDDLDELLQKDGFRGVHKGRTGEASDGCAIFWKKKQFKLLHREDIEFERFGLRNNVAQLCVLKMRKDSLSQSSKRSRKILVGNIHVIFNPKRGDIKLGQVRLFLDNANKLSQAWGNIPIIIAGDWNSTPASPMYQFLASSELDTRLHDRQNISGQFEYGSKWRDFRNMNKSSTHWSVLRSQSYKWSGEELKLATGSETTTHVRHQLKLCSAYTGVPGARRTRDFSGEPLATSYHSRFLGTVDYIWHTKDLVPVRVLETLPIDVLKRSRGLPSEKWGSDHLAIACEVAFTDVCNESAVTSASK